MMPPCPPKAWWPGSILAPESPCSSGKSTGKAVSVCSGFFEFVQKTTTFYNNRYLDSLTKS